MEIKLGGHQFNPKIEVEEQITHNYATNQKEPTGKYNLTIDLGDVDNLNKFTVLINDCEVELAVGKERREPCKQGSHYRYVRRGWFSVEHDQQRMYQEFTLNEIITDEKDG